MNENQRKSVLHKLKNIAQKVKGARHLQESIIEELDEIWALIGEETNGE